MGEGLLLSDAASGDAVTDISVTKTGGFPGGSEGEESACNAGDPGSIPGSERPPGEGNGLQYSHLENSVDRGAWQATVRVVTKRYN